MVAEEAQAACRHPVHEEPSSGMLTWSIWENIPWTCLKATRPHMHTLGVCCSTMDLAQVCITLHKTGITRLERWRLS